MFLESGELKKETIIEKLGLNILVEDEGTSREQLEKLNVELSEKNKALHDAGESLFEENKRLTEKNDSLEKTLSSTRNNLEDNTSKEARKKMIDYILMEGIELQTNIAEMDESGWWVKIHKETLQFNSYLLELVPLLPDDIRFELFKRIKASDEANGILDLIKSLPREKTIAEKISNYNPVPTIFDGVMIAPPFKITLDMSSLKGIVSKAKKLANLDKDK